MAPVSSSEAAAPRPGADHPGPMPDDDAARWRAIAARDRAADGRFVFAVTTTKIYCRPSCPARRPKPEHVRFLAGPAEAEAGGFRACKRCRPEAPDATAGRIAAACRRIAEAESPPALAELAGAAGLSPHHFHRLFKAATGLTPAGYARAHRAGRLRATLGQKEKSVTRALFDSGFNTASRFHAAADDALGMPSTAFRDGGAGMEIRHAIADCALGRVLVAASARGICAILLGDDAAELEADLARRFPRARVLAADAALGEIVAAVVALLATPGQGLDLPLDLQGTIFQQQVWQALRGIPAGTTVSYAELACRLGRPAAVRAVAGACAANPLAVVVPCHRVVRSDGGLSGYRWGIARKQALLAGEADATAPQDRLPLPPGKPRRPGR